MKVLFWGTADKGKPRTRILLAALKKVGADVSEIHVDIWQGVEDKSQLNRWERLSRYLRWAVAYPVLLAKFITSPKPDVVLLCYPAQADVLVLWVFAKLRGIPILMDLFLSIYDTMVIDRKVVDSDGLKARLLWRSEWLACRAANAVVLDTSAHAHYVEELFDLPQGQAKSLPVGVEADQFPPLPPAQPGARARILFYGQMIPLHGIDAVLNAALSERGRAYDWTFIGSGQEEKKLTAAFGDNPPEHIRWIRWVPYPELRDWIAKSDICLGIFGASRKAASVVPNKAFQALSSGRHVITRISPAVTELAPATEPGLTLVEPESSDALVDGIALALREGCPPPSKELIESFSLERIGERLLEIMDGMRTRTAG